MLECLPPPCRPSAKRFTAFCRKSSLQKYVTSIFAWCKFDESLHRRLFRSPFPASKSLANIQLDLRIRMKGRGRLWRQSATTHQCSRKCTTHDSALTSRPQPRPIANCLAHRLKSQPSSFRPVVRIGRDPLECDASTSSTWACSRKRRLGKWNRKWGTRGLRNKQKLKSGSSFEIKWRHWRQLLLCCKGISAFLLAIRFD